MLPTIQRKMISKAPSAIQCGYLLNISSHKASVEENALKVGGLSEWRGRWVGMMSSQLFLRWWQLLSQ